MRRKAPETPDELAAYIKLAGGFHAHRFQYTGGKRKRHWWRLVFTDETHRCFTENCFVLRVKKVEEAP